MRRRRAVDEVHDEAVDEVHDEAADLLAEEQSLDSVIAGAQDEEAAADVGEDGDSAEAEVS